MYGVYRKTGVVAYAFDHGPKEDPSTLHRYYSDTIESLMIKSLHGRQRAGASMIDDDCAWVPTLTLHSVAGLLGGLAVARQHDTACDTVAYADTREYPCRCDAG